MISVFEGVCPGEEDFIGHRFCSAAAPVARTARGLYFTNAISSRRAHSATAASYGDKDEANFHDIAHCLYRSDLFRKRSRCRLETKMRERLAQVLQPMGP